MIQTAPGRYQVEFDTTRQGEYHLEFSQKNAGQIVSRQSRGLAVGYPDELRIKPTNRDLLRDLAIAGGGRFDLPAEAVFAPSDRVVSRDAALAVPDRLGDVPLRPGRRTPADRFRPGPCRSQIAAGPSFQPKRFIVQSSRHCIGRSDS